MPDDVRPRFRERAFVPFEGERSHDQQADRTPITYCSYLFACTVENSTLNEREFTDHCGIPFHLWDTFLSKMSTEEVSETSEPMKDEESLIGVVLFIKENDVLFGRGNHTKNHPGNKYYRSLVSAVKDIYSDYPKDRKQLISELIYECIKSLEPPGLFVHELRGDKWEEVEKKDALRKISQALREKKCLAPTEYELGYDHKKSNEEEQFQLMKALLQHVAFENRKQVPTFSNPRFSTKTEMPIETLRSRLAELRGKAATRNSIHNLSTSVPCPLAMEISSNSSSGSLPFSTEDRMDVMMTMPSIIGSSLPSPPSQHNYSFTYHSSQTMHPPPYHNHHPPVPYSQPNIYFSSYKQPIHNPIVDPSSTAYNNESYEIASVLSSMKFATR